jgi:hypothetical protein
MRFFLLNQDEMGLIGITDGAPPVLRKVLNLRPRFDAEEGIAVEGIIFEDIADVTPVSYHTIAAANGEIFSLEIIKWFEIAGPTGRRAHETKESVRNVENSGPCPSCLPLIFCRWRTHMEHVFPDMNSSICLKKQVLKYPLPHLTSLVV